MTVADKLRECADRAENFNHPKGWLDHVTDEHCELFRAAAAQLDAYERTVLWATRGDETGWPCDDCMDRLCRHLDPVPTTSESI